MKKKDHFYSFVFISPHSHTSRTFRLRVTTFYLFLSTILVALCVLGITLYLNVNSSIQQTRLKELKTENELYSRQLDAQNDTLNDLQYQLELLIEKEEEINLILGETKFRSPSYRNKINRNSKKKINSFKSSYNKVSEESLTVASVVSEKLSFLSEYTEEKLELFNFYLDKSNQFKSRFASTPSIRPLYGRLLSKFGYRRHPITGLRKMHKGIDIAAWIGAPIHATADGVIEYAGWSGTFGNVVVIDHDFGYRTIYAHCSQLLVKKYELVKKGQVIAQVGTTGISTGPHLHYEVRRWRKALNPIAYLDLDMFTASTEVW